MGNYLGEGGDTLRDSWELKVLIYYILSKLEALRLMYTG